MEPREEYRDPMGSRPGSNIPGEAQRMKDEMKEGASRVADKARDASQRLAGRAREQATRLVGERKDRAASSLDSLSGVLRDNAGRLRGEQSFFGDYAESVAERVDRLARYLRDGEPEKFYRDVENYARSRPEIFVGGMFLSGLLLARFLKSSSDQASDNDFVYAGGGGGGTPGRGRAATDTALPAGERVVRRFAARAARWNTPEHQRRNHARRGHRAGRRVRARAIAMATQGQAPGRDERSLGELLKELTGEIRDLFRKEVELARTETAEKASRFGTNAAAVAVGAAVVLVAGFVLIEAVVRGLTALFDQFMALELAVWIAPLLVGGVLAIVGYSRMKTALGRLRSESLMPQKTKETLQENAQWLKAKMK